MARFIIEDLDSEVVEKLEALAKQHGRSLQAELKYILQAAVQAQTLNQPVVIELAKTLPEDFIHDIRAALEREDTKTAQQLAHAAVEHYPDDEELKKYAYVLAPPMITFGNPPNSDRRMNREWLMTNFVKYRGRWVALRGGQLLADSSSLKELKDCLGDTEGVLITAIS